MTISASLHHADSLKTARFRLNFKVLHMNKNKLQQHFSHDISRLIICFLCTSSATHIQYIYVVSERIKWHSQCDSTQCLMSLKDLKVCILSCVCASVCVCLSYLCECLLLQILCGMSLRSPRSRGG